MMAQTMVLMAGVSSAKAFSLKRCDPLLNIQIQKIKPQSSSSFLSFSPLPSSNPPRSPPSSSGVVKVFAIFKSRAKAAPKKVEKEKLKVEDGIFGTSGGIGFTKENELFVGRVAMLGFAEHTNEQGREEHKLTTKLLELISILIVSTSPMIIHPPTSSAAALDAPKAAALFRRACIGCHDAGGNIIQPGATLYTDDLQRNGVDSEDGIYNVTYFGKGRMPGFGEKCSPRGQCTFGPRLLDEDIRLLAQFVKSQAQQGWPTIEIYGH